MGADEGFHVTLEEGLRVRVQGLGFRVRSLVVLGENLKGWV